LGICELKDLANPAFDPHIADDVAFGAIENPWPVIADFRRKAPVCEGEYRTFFGGGGDPTLADMKHYTVWGYDEVDGVRPNPRRDGSTRSHPLPQIPPEHLLAQAGPAMDRKSDPAGDP
jgi:hypothetical protein